jgi:hypothetical protein
MSLDLAFFSFNQHQDLLVPGLKNAIRQVPDLEQVILVWDDYVRQRPIDFDQVQDQVGHNIKVVLHTDLDPWPEAIGQWGWIKQQLVKLRCHEYSTADHVWIVDGDVMVTGDPELFREGRPVLRYDYERTVDLSKSQYHDFIRKYFGIDNFYPYTWVGSTCVFDTKICEEIWAVCQQRNGKSLTKCVEETIAPLLENFTQHWPFSEFELYGSYCYSRKPDAVVIDKKNWNYAPMIKGLDRPIQIMWQRFAPDIVNKFKES